MIALMKALPTAYGQRLGYFFVGSRGGAETALNTAGMVGYAGGAWSDVSRPTYLAFETISSGSVLRTERLRIAANGFLGIGTNAPAYLLDVAGRIRLRSGGGTAGLWLNNTGNTSTMGFMGASTDNTLGFYGKGSGWSLLMNTTNGFVGIGTANPQHALHVTTPTAPSAVYAVNTKSGPIDRIGVYGESVNYPYYGIGVKGFGGWLGVYAQTNSDGQAGIYASGPIGVYAVGEGGPGINAYTDNPNDYAGYFQGDVFTTGTYQPSERSFKQNITDVVSALDLINKLQPRSFEYRQDSNFKLMNLPTGKHYGLIAQEVEKVLPQLVKETKFNPASAQPAAGAKRAQKGETIDFKAVNYTEFTPILMKAVQELSKKTDEIEELKKTNDQLEARLRKLEDLLTRNNSALTSVSSAYLEQNTPNPAVDMTTIRYGVPDGASSARLTLTNSQGQLLKTIALTGRGAGQINLNTSPLSSGLYTYTLWVGSREVGSKQLIITR